MTPSNTVAIIGATGNVGAATSSALRAAGVPVRALVRTPAKATQLAAIGCEIVQADLQDAAALAAAIGDAEAVQVIVPVSPRAVDPAADLRRSIEGVAEALAITRPKHVLVISDYGAHVADDIGMPSIFRALEARLAGHALILRSAEHMHNWARSIPAALSSGALMTFQDPIVLAQPTISAQDLGRIAADLLRHPGEPRVVHAEGPRRYSATDVAAVLSELTGKPIRARAIPRAQWTAALAQLPPSLANLLVGANDAKNQGGRVDVEAAGEVRRGTTELIDALRPIVSADRDVVRG